MKRLPQTRGLLSSAPMFKLTTTGPRAEIEAAQDLLFETDPTPVGAVDAREETRTLWRLDAYAEEREDIETARELIACAFAGLSLAIEPVPERDWVKVSLEGLPAVIAGPFVVAGSHALSAMAPGCTSILIEAGPAFGTGHHGTTKGCLEAYAKLRRRKRTGRVLDVGTGSGVLAIAALKTRAALAIGTDIDAESVRVARENLSLNHAAFRGHMLEASGARHGRIHAHAPYDLIFANILAGPLVSLSAELAGLTASGGHVILSGLLNHQEPLVRAAYGGHGLSLIDRLRRDGWSTLVYRRPR